MDESALQYDIWVEQALRGVIRRALEYVQTEGLPGDHHFYITFLTGAEGVQIADFLRAEYPEEMTIVLQHQFWDLDVGDDVFVVTLSFNGISQHLRIPFAAVTAFADPAINFALQLKLTADGTPSRPGVEPATIAPHDGPAAGPAAAAADQAAKEEKSGEVIALDAFRKK